MRIPVNRRSLTPRFVLKVIAGWLPLLCLACLPAFTLAQEVTGNSTIGPRTSHIFTLRIPPDPADPNDYGDTLPPGDAIYYQFGIFDTGATVVAINNVSLTGTDGTVYVSTANYLDLCGAGDTVLAALGTEILSRQSLQGSCQFAVLAASRQVETIGLSGEISKQFPPRFRSKQLNLATP